MTGNHEFDIYLCGMVAAVMIVGRICRMIETIKTNTKPKE